MKIRQQPNVRSPLILSSCLSCFNYYTFWITENTAEGKNLEKEIISVGKSTKTG
jgi:hypothetical protein